MRAIIARIKGTDWRWNFERKQIEKHYLLEPIHDQGGVPEVPSGMDETLASQSREPAARENPQHEMETKKPRRRRRKVQGLAQKEPREAPPVPSGMEKAG